MSSNPIRPHCCRGERASQDTLSTARHTFDIVLQILDAILGRVEKTKRRIVMNIISIGLSKIFMVEALEFFGMIDPRRHSGHDQEIRNGYDAPFFMMAKIVIVVISLSVAFWTLAGRLIWPKVPAFRYKIMIRLRFCNGPITRRSHLSWGGGLQQITTLYNLRCQAGLRTSIRVASSASISAASWVT